MHALVTGGAGFIGSNIVKLLLEKGHDVRIIDDLSSGCLRNIKQYVDAHALEFINADICDPSSVEDACAGIDTVFHLAACVGRRKSLDNPVLDSVTNLAGTVNVLEGMRKNGVTRIVYSSSAAIFGEPMSEAIAEDHPYNANSPYGVSKLAAENMILAYSKLYGITGISLRYFNIYGINQRFSPYGNVIPIFAGHILSSRPVTVYGDGTQTRDFLNVRDVAQANLLAAFSERGTAVYNLGSGGSVTVNQLAQMMKDIAGSDVPVVYAPERPADVKHCTAVPEKAYRELGFHSEISIEDGLVEYMDWFTHES